MKKVIIINILLLLLFSPLYSLTCLNYKKNREDTINKIAEMLQEQDQTDTKSAKNSVINNKDIAQICFELYFDNTLDFKENVENLKKYTLPLKEFAKENTDKIKALKEHYDIQSDMFSKYSSLKKNLPTMIEFADFYYAKSGNAKDAYFKLLQNHGFANEYKRSHLRLTKKLAQNPKENAEVVFRICVSFRYNDLAIKMLEYLESDKINKLNFKTLFADAIRNGNIETLENLLKHNKFLTILNELESKRMSALSFYLAFCKFYGYGIKKDEKQANEILEKYSKLPFASISDYDTLQVALSELKGGSDFYLSLANKLKLRGNPNFYITFLRLLDTPYKDLALAMQLSYLHSISTDKHVFYPYIIQDFVELYNAGKSNKKLEEIAYYFISKEIKDGYISNINIFYNLLLLGCGNDNDKIKIFEAINNEYEKNPTNLDYIEKLAFCYDNAIGTLKDEEKAKNLRLKIDDLIKEIDDKYIQYSIIYMNYKPDKLDIRTIYSPKMNEYYKTKIKANKPKVNK